MPKINSINVGFKTYRFTEIVKTIFIKESTIG